MQRNRSAVRMPAASSRGASAPDNPDPRHEGEELIDDGFWRGGLDGIGAIRRHCLERRGRGHARQAHFLVGFEQPGGRFRFNPDGTSIGPYGVTVSASSIGWTTTSGPAKSTR